MSTVTVTPDRARELCRTYLEDRQRYLAAERETMIQEAMQRTWWQRLLRRPARTRAEAIRWLEGGGNFSDWGLLSIRGLLWAGPIQDLYDSLADGCVSEAKVDTEIYAVMLGREAQVKARRQQEPTCSTTSI